MKIGVLFRPLHVLDGMNIACERYLHALAKERAEDIIQLLVQAAHWEDARQFAESMPGNVVIVPLSDIALQVPDLLFGLDPQLMSGLMEIRNTVLKQMIPVLGLTHTLSAPVTRDVFVQVMRHAQACDTLIATSCAARSMVTRLMAWIQGDMPALKFAGRICVVPLGIDSQVFCPGNAAQAREALGWPKEAMIIGVVARMSAFTKMELTTHIAAFRQWMALAKVDAHLVFIGKNESDGYLAKLRYQAQEWGIADHIEFLCDFLPEQAPVIYRAVDYLMSLSDHVQETFGQIILEAMASETPVLVSDWDGYRDLVTHSITGFKVPVYSADCMRALDLNMQHPLASQGYVFDRYYHLLNAVAVDQENAAGAMQLLQDSGLRTWMGKNARAAVLSCYDWSVVVRQLLAVFEESQAIASTLSGPPEIPRAWFPYSQLFRSYPTHWLSAETGIQQTDLGAQYLTGQWVLVEMSGQWNLLFERPPLLREVVTLAQTPVTLQAIINRLSDSSPEDVQFSVMYAMKYGLIKCVVNPDLSV